MTAKELEEIIENAGYETRRYSGRFMYGKECVAFEVEHGDEYKAIAEIMYSHMMSLMWDEPEGECYTDKTVSSLSNLSEILGRVKIDEMGRDNYILYFPQVKYEEE